MMKKILAFLIAAVLFTSYILPESFAAPSIKKSDEIRCNNIFPKFLKMGEEKFRERYPAYPIMDKCMKMFKDPDFVKSKEPQEQTADNTKISKILSSKKIGTSKFLTHFSICQDSEIRPKYVKITTDREEVFGKIIKTPTENCPKLWVIAYYENSSNVDFSWHNEKIPKEKIIREILG